MTFTLYSNGVVEKDGFRVPFDELNADYQEYIAFLEGGGTPESQPASVYLDKLNDFELNKQSLKDEYNNALSTLAQIRDADPGSVTANQVVIAVQFMAKVLIFILKLLARTL